mmetsp:Transcript_2169/g.4856  ORF Transcript_2169/g.4856 Transcript_2169/m.4856 type:complete len:201 (-) Transcript_2169:325-927(-)
MAQERRHRMDHLSKCFCCRLHLDRLKQALLQSVRPRERDVLKLPAAARLGRLEEDGMGAILRLHHREGLHKFIPTRAIEQALGRCNARRGPFAIARFRKQHSVDLCDGEGVSLKPHEPRLWPKQHVPLQLLILALDPLLPAECDEGERVHGNHEGADNCKLQHLSRLRHCRELGEEGTHVSRQQRGLSTGCPGRRHECSG